MEASEMLAFAPDLYAAGMERVLGSFAALNLCNTASVSAKSCPSTRDRNPGLALHFRPGHPSAFVLLGFGIRSG